MKTKRHKWKKNPEWAGGSFCVNCLYSRETIRIQKRGCKKTRCRK